MAFVNSGRNLLLGANKQTSGQAHALGLNPQAEFGDIALRS